MATVIGGLKELYYKANSTKKSNTQAAYKYWIILAKKSIPTATVDLHFFVIEKNKNLKNHMRFSSYFRLNIL